ncbi:MAG: NAD(P)-dependent oxidoreductase, partial [Imperialibacter sp.]
MRILLTGSGGFIGSYLYQMLVAEGHATVGLSSSKSRTTDIAVNLLDPTQVKGAIAGEHFDLLIHCAAIAHGQKAPIGETCYTANAKMTQNILDAISGKCSYVILLSSVAVYGEDGRREEVSVHSELRPSDEYGKSKLQSEKILWDANLIGAYALRLTPVFHASFLDDVKKRVFLPFTGIRFRTGWERKYSLCSLETLGTVIKEILKEKAEGKWIYQVADVNPYTQEELASRFTGPFIEIPPIVAQSVYLFLRWIP